MKRCLAAVLFALFATKSISQVRWTFELHGGTAYNVPMPLVVHQEGFPEIRLTARFKTEAFTPPIYWDWRFSRWNNAKSWEFEAIHHKLYLVNTTSEIEKFNISHGFNIIMVNRGFDKGKFLYRFGAGIVLAHPESSIRGLEFGNSADSWDMGYFISGPIVNFAVSKPIRLNNRFFINMEAKTTLAYVYIKINQGHADVYSFAVHLILGLGVNINKSTE